MKKLIIICLAAAMILVISNAANADWNVGDPYKMHYPQLPNPEGWDVFAGGGAGYNPGEGTYTYLKYLADDWQCTETGPVADIHLWGSWKNDIVGTITGIDVRILSDIPAGTSYSRPGNQLWQQFFTPTQFTYRDYGTGPQGWYNPNTGEYARPDHEKFHQINITDIVDPFIQQVGTIYWLAVNVFTDQPNHQWGWKTSQNHWNDDAVWADWKYFPGSGIGYWTEWMELRDPITQQSLDLAFVITPEPATVGLLGLGALSLIRRKK